MVRKGNKKSRTTFSQGSPAIILRPEAFRPYLTTSLALSCIEYHI